MEYYKANKFEHVFVTTVLSIILLVLLKKIKACIIMLQELATYKKMPDKSFILHHLSNCLTITHIVQNYCKFQQMSNNIALQCFIIKIQYIINENITMYTVMLTFEKSFK